jgi:hypothetical protein
MPHPEISTFLKTFFWPSTHQKRDRLDFSRNWAEHIKSDIRSMERKVRYDNVVQLIRASSARDKNLAESEVEKLCRFLDHGTVFNTRENSKEPSSWGPVCKRPAAIPGKIEFGRCTNIMFNLVQSCWDQEFWQQSLVPPDHDDMLLIKMSKTHWRVACSLQHHNSH